MSINCKSSCVSYVTEKNITSATVDTYQCVNNSSKCSNTVSPAAFPVTVTIDTSKSPDTIYHISVGPVGNPTNLNYDLIIDKNGAGTLGPNIPNGVSISFPLGQGGNQPCGSPDSAVTRITLVFANNSLYPSGSTSEMPYQTNDNYTINVLSCCNNSTKSIDVAFERPLWQAIIPECPNSSGIASNTPDCVSPCQNVKVPLLFINGQTTIDGSDIADMLFTIYDKYSYENPIPLPKTKVCSVNYVDKIDLVKTVLRICSVKIVSVLRGKGSTAYCKADYIWMNLKPTTYLTTFYDNLIAYAMLKFILSRLLYGNFDINHLLANYNEKFLHDLGHSRFCAFIQNFEDCQSPIYGYNKYFKKEKVCDEVKPDKHIKHDKPIKETEEIEEIDFRYEKAEEAEEDDKKEKKAKKAKKVEKIEKIDFRYEKDEKGDKKVKETKEIKEIKKSKKSNKNDINSEDFV